MSPDRRDALHNLRRCQDFLRAERKRCAKNNPAPVRYAECRVEAALDRLWGVQERERMMASEEIKERHGAYRKSDTIRVGWGDLSISVMCEASASRRQ